MFFLFFNDTATTEIYTLSLHDALPICSRSNCPQATAAMDLGAAGRDLVQRWVTGEYVLSYRQFSASGTPDRKSTRLNSSHGYISYAVFCLKKKIKKTYNLNNILLNSLQ